MLKKHAKGGVGLLLHGLKKRVVFRKKTKSGFSDQKRDIKKRLKNTEKTPKNSTVKRPILVSGI